MNINKVNYTYVAPGIVRQDEVKIIANSEAEVREAFDTLYQSDDTEGRFYVITSIEPIAFGELF